MSDIVEDRAVWEARIAAGEVPDVTLVDAAIDHVAPHGNNTDEEMA